MLLLKKKDMSVSDTLSLNAFQIKCLACLFMLIDHIGILLITPANPAYVYFRLAGRLALPLFAYMLANGYRHTGSVGKYLLRLAVFAVIIQAVYYLALGGKDINIFATLALGLLSIIAWDKLNQGRDWSVGGVLAVAAAAAAAQQLHMDYGVYGVLLIFSCHVLYDRLALLALVWTALALGAHQLHWVGQNQIFAACALLLIALYNDQPGPRGFWAKWGFYLFYCLHLPLLYGISLLIQLV